jgi:hypothetical protein
VARKEQPIMFMMTMPKTFKVGDTADCRINAEPARIMVRRPPAIG